VLRTAYGGRNRIKVNLPEGMGVVNQPNCENHRKSSLIVSIISSTIP
jgi:hypothetical protein